MFKKFRYTTSLSKELLAFGYSPEQLPSVTNPTFHEYINFCRDSGMSAKNAANLLHGLMKDDKTSIEKLKDVLPFGLKLSLLGEEALGEEFIGKEVEGKLLDHIMSLYPNDDKPAAREFLKDVCGIFPTYTDSDILSLIFFSWTSDRHNIGILVLRRPDLVKIQSKVQEILHYYSEPEVYAYRSALQRLKQMGKWI